MKKILTLFVTLLFLLSMQTQSLAAEDRPGISYFGTGAFVQDLGDGTFLVKTEGVKEEEGFVHTPRHTFSNEKISYQITLKGKGTVIFRISATDARGRFIKQEELVIELTEQWTTHVLPIELEGRFIQLDVSVVTQNKAETEFSFKDLKITEE